MRIGEAMIALAALGLMASAPTRVVEPRRYKGAQPRSEALLRAAMIAGHDAARAAVGAPRLAWDDALAADALGYADVLTRTRALAHADQPQGRGRQGENLWMGTRLAYRYEEMVAAWVAERRFLKSGRIPDVSTTGRFADIGHYTQVVWPTTTRFGCALAANDTDEYLVCRYAPAGNVMGRSPQTG